MTQTAVARLAAPPQAELRELRLDHNQIHWRVARQYEWLVRGPAAPNWSRLASCPTAELIKRNEVREVWRVLLGQESFYAKIYFGSGLRTRIKNRLRGAACLTEWRTGWYALGHRIPSIVPVACGLSTSPDDPVTGVLVTAALDDAVPLDVYWEGLDTEEPGGKAWNKVEQLTEAVAEAIARAHHGGFEHLDMHVGNLLAQGGQDGPPVVTFVDLHSVRINRPINDPAAVRNLAQLNQWFMRHASRSTRLRFLPRYSKWRQLLAGNEAEGRAGGSPELDLGKLAPIMERAARRHAGRLWAKRDRRTMRHGKYFARLKFVGGWTGHAFLQAKRPLPHSRASWLRYSAHEWEQWLANPSRWVAAQARGEVLKDSHSALVFRTRLPADTRPLEVVVKTSRRRRRLKRLAGMFRASRDLRRWKTGYALLNRDVPTPRPLAVLQRRFCRLLRESLIICEAIQDAKDLDRYVLDDLPSLDSKAARQAKDGLIEVLVRLLKRLHSREFVHRDFKAANILVKLPREPNGPARAWLVDVDGIKQKAVASEQDRLRPLVRLSVSLEVSPQVTRSDRLRFLKRYMLAPGKTDRDWKPLWRRLATEANRKRLLKRRRDQWKLKHYGRL